MMTDWNHSTPLAAVRDYPLAMIPLRIEGVDPTNPALDTFEQVALATVIAAAVNGAGQLPSGQAGSIDLFVNVAAHALPTAVTAFITGGCSTAGVGSGTYVADGVATAALAAACPRFCAADRTGRYFRLAAAGRVIAVSQGGALGGANNDQPAVQAAINYAAAIGARTLLFDFDTISLWCPVRTSPTSGDPAAFSADGQSLWVTAPIKFKGVGSGSHVRMLGINGASLETGWQNIGGTVWRGSGINLMGGPSAASPATYGLTGFAMENIWLDGGCAYTGVRTAVTPASPDGPDLTNKGIRLQNTQCDKIILTNCIISGFKGEACYFAGSTQTLQILKNTQVFGSNQSAFNPSTGTVQADNCDFGGSFISVECLGGIGGRYTGCKFHDAAQTGVTGGPANGLLYNYAYPTRIAAQAPPWIDMVNCDFHNAGQLLVGNYIRIIRGRATDCTIALNTAITNGSLTSTYIDLEYTIDQATQSPICALTGPPTLTTMIPGATGATYVAPPSDVHVRMNIHRTANAAANGRYAVAYSVTGFIDQNSCSLQVGEADGVAYMVAPVGNLALPLLSMDGPTSSHLIGSGRPLGMYPAPISAGPYALAVSNPRMSLQYTGAAAAIAITMAAPFAAPYGYAFGQKTRIYWDTASTTGTTYTFAHNGGGLRLNADCTLAVFGDWIEVEFNAATGLWHEIGRSIHVA
jgi:hypothetical protein